MILVFGGTTEGRRAAEVLEEAGSPFFYSTKTGEQELTLHHGRCIDGAMDAKAMLAFCEEHQIRLVVDAAHPFALQLHKTIALMAEKAQIPVVRYERIYPPRDPEFIWIDDYSGIPRDIHSLLATTGVQSITKLKTLEAEGIKLYYRILNRESSIALAMKQGAREEQLCFYEDSRLIDVEAEAILLKESGVSGGFNEKVAAAREKGMKVIVVKRPLLPASIMQVNGPHGLRRAVEKLLPEFYPLHSGLTTGTCATAAAIAATLALNAQADSSFFNLHSSLPNEVPVILPNGETIMVPVAYGEGYASCQKEAGDDPDVTNGIEVRAIVQPHPIPEGGESIVIEGGEGVGIITLSGFDYPPGSPAINKSPREMIRQNIKELYEHSNLPSLKEGLKVSISVPNGAEIARRTFNPRLGIEGGISIIGVSGIVKPFSEEAFIDSIRKCMSVAKASGTDRVVMNSGAKSERFVKALYPALPRQAFVEYGNYIGEALKMACELGFEHVTLGVMLGKAVKLAAGHLDTHSRRSTMDKGFIQQMLNEAHCELSITNVELNLARELWQALPPAKLQDFANVVIGHCKKHCQPLIPHGELTVLLIDDDGNVYA
jgi:cobalt-precorrin-5B (C1)-methyltransferase